MHAMLWLLLQVAPLCVVPVIKWRNISECKKFWHFASFFGLKTNAVSFNDKQFSRSFASPFSVCSGAVDLRRSWMEVSRVRVLEWNSCAMAFPISRRLLIERVRSRFQDNIYKLCDGSFEKEILTSKTSLSQEKQSPGDIPEIIYLKCLVLRLSVEDSHLKIWLPSTDCYCYNPQKPKPRFVINFYCCEQRRHLDSSSFAKKMNWVLLKRSLKKDQKISNSFTVDATKNGFSSS